MSEPKICIAGLGGVGGEDPDPAARRDPRHQRQLRILCARRDDARVVQTSTDRLGSMRPLESIVKTALTEASIGGTDRQAVDEAGALAVVQREAKRRRDAAAEYEKAGSPERAAQELAELAVLERYLPRQLTEAEIEEIARDVIAQVQAQSMADMGQVMSAIMPRVAGVADGRAVNQVIRKLLAAQRK